MIRPATTFGNQVRALREKRGLSQQAAADLAGMHRPSWTRIETGRHDAAGRWREGDPPLSTLAIVASVLECRIVVERDGSVRIEP